MKLGKNGWGYGIFIICVCMISAFVLIANHYMVILIASISG